VVTLGGTTDGQRQVLSGLAAGETVITDPPPQLRDGMSARIARS